VCVGARFNGVRKTRRALTTKTGKTRRARESIADMTDGVVALRRLRSKAWKAGFKPRKTIVVYTEHAVFLGYAPDWGNQSHVPSLAEIVAGPVDEINDPLAEVLDSMVQRAYHGQSR